MKNRLRDTNPALLGSPILSVAQPWTIGSLKGTNALDEGAHAVWLYVFQAVWSVRGIESPDPVAWEPLYHSTQWRETDSYIVNTAIRE